MARPKALRAAAALRVGQDLNPIFLATNHGLDHPVLMDVHGTLVTFSKHIRIKLAEQVGREADVALPVRSRTSVGIKELRDELGDVHFQVWAMNPFLDPNGRVSWDLPEDSILLRPEAEIKTLYPAIGDVYWDIIGPHREVDSARPNSLIWYLGDNRYRLALRPYRDENVVSHGLVIVTTLPREQSLSPVA